MLVVLYTHVELKGNHQEHIYAVKPIPKDGRDTCHPGNTKTGKTISCS